MQLIKSNSIIIFLFFTKNNLLCTITNLKGKVLITKSVGFFKIKGIKKITNITIFQLIKSLNKYFFKYKNLYIKVKGINKNKTEFLKLLKIMGYNILSIQEKFLLAHGGCKKKKLRKI